MRLVSIERNGTKEAKVYFDPDTQEYNVKFIVDGKHMYNADYFTDDKSDAIATARTIWDAPIKKAKKQRA